ncbi:MAG: radical SAM protein [Spirochaetaceae bacterium]|jgi:DNA repair photolyase|nr:radical SAM protein [Spirochaetaceae bacterium]
MQIDVIPASSPLVKSRLPAADYCVNPYTGCSHACRYCYAVFTKRFTPCKAFKAAPWGSYIMVKDYKDAKIQAEKIKGKVVLLSSVTDPYQGAEKQYGGRRRCLELLRPTEARVEILTKSDLVLRDIDLLKTTPHLTVGVSLVSDDDGVRRVFEPGAPSAERRIAALKQLKAAGVKTYLFISPILPGLTGITALANALGAYAGKIMFENLNLREPYKKTILALIKHNYPHLTELYEEIYIRKNLAYWREAEKEIAGVNHADKQIFFHHGGSQAIGRR